MQNRLADVSRRGQRGGHDVFSVESDAPTFFMSFHTLLGWMAIVGSERGLRQLTLAHRSQESAAAAVGRKPARNSRRPPWVAELAQKLRAYAAGEPIDFSGVPLEMNWHTPFQFAVIQACRTIGYGQTMTYGQLAEAAGSPRAARAVGNVMASNPTPLVVPCHRVVGSGGALGGFSAGEGVALKKKLLEMEAAHRGLGLLLRG